MTPMQRLIHRAFTEANGQCVHSDRGYAQCDDLGECVPVSGLVRALPLTADLGAEQLRGLSDAATQGPWDDDSGTGRLRRPAGLIGGKDFDGEQAAADARFIVAAVTFVRDALRSTVVGE